MMMNALKFCLVAMLFAGSVAAAGQGPGSGVGLEQYSGGSGKSGGSSPSGSTPEPTSLLLLAGGAVVYGGLRSRKRLKKGAAQDS